MGVVQSYLKGRTLQENLAFCLKFVKYKKKNTKMGLVQSYLKRRIPQENLVFCQKFLKYKKNAQESKWELCKVKLKGRIPQEKIGVLLEIRQA